MIVATSGSHDVENWTPWSDHVIMGLDVSRNNERWGLVIRHVTYPDGYDIDKKMGIAVSDVIPDMMIQMLGWWELPKSSDHQKLTWKFGIRTSWVILFSMTHRKSIMDMRLGLKFYVMLQDLVGCSCPDVMKTWVLTTSQSKFWHGCWDPVKKSWWDVKKWGPDLKSLGSRPQSLMGPDVDF